MIHFKTLFALVVGSIQVIQPTGAGILNAFQHRQTTSTPQVPPQCASICDPVNAILASPSGVSYARWYHLYSDNLMRKHQCTLSQCCLASFENGFYSCDICVGTNDTDYSTAQATLDSKYLPFYVEEKLRRSLYAFIALYDDCAGLGIQLPVLTFPGQNPNRTLSSVVQFPSSQATASVSTPSTVQSTISAPTSSVVHITVSILTSSGTLTSSATSAISPQSTATTHTPNSSSTSSSGIRSMEISCFNLIAGAMVIGTWFYFAVLWELALVFWQLDSYGWESRHVRMLIMIQFSV